MSCFSAGLWKHDVSPGWRRPGEMCFSRYRPKQAISPGWKGRFLVLVKAFGKNIFPLSGATWRGCLVLAQASGNKTSPLGGVTQESGLSRSLRKQDISTGWRHPGEIACFSKLHWKQDAGANQGRGLVLVRASQKQIKSPVSRHPKDMSRFGTSLWTHIQTWRKNCKNTDDVASKQ